MSISGQDVRNAAAQLEGHVLRTPMVVSPLLSQQLGCNIYTKLECLQYTSSFKARGAFIAMQSLSDEQRSAGVIAMSAGNHAQAVAYHAGQMGIPAVIVMPSQTPFAKIARTRAYGAEVVLEGRNLNDCESKVQALIDSRGLTLIHPYDNNEVMIGQGTVGLEMLIDQPDLDVLVVPIGGGGLVGGIATIAKEMRPDIRIIGVQTEAYPSMHAAMLGRDIVCGGETLAEGIAVKKPGGVTLPVVQALVDEIVLVNEKHLEWAVTVSYTHLTLPTKRIV